MERGWLFGNRPMPRRRLQSGPPMTANDALDTASDANPANGSGATKRFADHAARVGVSRSRTTLAGGRGAQTA